MRIGYIFLAFALSGCAADRMDAEHKERIQDLEIARLKELNHELAKAAQLNQKVLNHILQRIEELELQRDGLNTIIPKDPVIGI